MFFYIKVVFLLLSTCQTVKNSIKYNKLYVYERKYNMIFTKMQCIGNDFLILNGFDDIIEVPEDLPLRVCDRHFGIGADGLALILYSNDADFRLDFFNPDGIKSPCNTNILRCAVKYALDNNIVDKDLISVDTDNGIKYVKAENDERSNLIINIGEPIFTPHLIPVDYTGDEFIEKVIPVGANDYVASCVLINSNPCTVIFTENTEKLNDIEINKIAPFIEKHNVFPNNTNVIFANIEDHNTIQVRCWQMNSGEVIGCDFGAVAAFVIANYLGKVDDKVSAELYGGDLKLELSNDNFVYVIASAENVFEINW